MRLKLDLRGVQFFLTKPAVPKVDRETGTQRADRDTGEMLFTVQVMALDESGGEVFAVTVPALASGPEVSVGQPVRLFDLVAIPWSQGDRSGVAFRASRWEPVAASSPTGKAGSPASATAA